MLIECPHCSAKYKLPLVAIGSEGRMMRCAKCHQEWFQKPNENILEEDEQSKIKEFETIENQIRDLNSLSSESYEPQGDEGEDEYQDEDDQSDIKDEEPSIPQGIAPHDDNDHENQDYNDDEDGEEYTEPHYYQTQSPPIGAAGVAISLAAAFIVMLALPSTAIFFKDKVVKLAPFSRSLYEAVGMDMRLDEENFVIETVQSYVRSDNQGQDYIYLTGQVINISDTPKIPPKIIATILDQDQKELGSWMIDLPADPMDAYDAITFTTDYPTIPDQATSIKVSFNVNL